MSLLLIYLHVAMRYILDTRWPTSAKSQFISVFEKGIKAILLFFLLLVLIVIVIIVRQLPYALVNCIECFTPRFLFESILLQLENCNDSGTTDVDDLVYPRCDNMNAFLRLLKYQIKDQNRKEETVYIVLDKAERLRDMDTHILPAFLRLQELSNCNICVIMISEIALEKFRFGTGFREHITVYFPEYSKQELLQIMSRDCPPEQLRGFYTAYCQLLLSVFYAVCRDLNELRHLVGKTVIALYRTVLMLLCAGVICLQLEITCLNKNANILLINLV